MLKIVMINKLNRYVAELQAMWFVLQDQDQKQWIAEAISNLQTVRNKLNE